MHWKPLSRHNSERMGLVWAVLAAGGALGALAEAGGTGHRPEADRAVRGAAGPLQPQQALPHHDQHDNQRKDGDKAETGYAAVAVAFLGGHG